MALTQSEMIELSIKVAVNVDTQMTDIYNNILKLNEVYDLMGLDPTKPLVVTQTSRTTGTITQSIEVDNDTKTSTITRL
jgi:hypothetical protein